SDRSVVLKALTSPSEYVRYLAARRRNTYARDDEIEDKVMSDPSLLVRYSQVTGMNRKVSNENFDRYPKVQKLAVVSSDYPPEAATLAGWIEHAAETKSVGEDEIYDVILEYLSNAKALRWLQETSYNFFTDQEREEGFKLLWG